MTKSRYPNPYLAEARNETKVETLRRWLTSRQAAIYLGLTLRALEGYVRRKQLIPFKPFGRLLFDQMELDRIVVASRK